MRDYLIISVVLASLPIGLFKPFYGLLVYAWLSYMYPHELAWSFAKSLPFAKLSALSLGAGLILTQTRNYAALNQRENASMFLLWCTFTFSSFFAIYPDRAWAKWQDASKLVIMSFVASLVLKSQAQIRQFLLVIALSLGFYGVKGGIFGILTGGNEMVAGPGRSIIGSNNSIGLALNMCLPVLWYMAREEKGWKKRLLQLTFFLTIPAIMFTYSRASAYTLGVTLLVIALRSRHRIVLVALALAAAAAAAPFIPQKWIDRQQTVLTYEEDTSAMSRLDNWSICWKVAMDHPLTGAGFDFQSYDVFAKYAPGFLLKYGGSVWDTHNIFFGILTSHGFPGLVSFVAMIVFCFTSCSALKRKVRNYPDLRWVSTYSEMIQMSFVAFIVNGMFVNMEYFDLPYHWVAVVAVMKVIVSRQLSEHTSEIEVMIPPAAAVA